MSCSVDDEACFRVEELGSVIARGFAGVDRDGDVLAGGSDFAEDVEGGLVVAVSKVAPMSTFAG